MRYFAYVRELSSFIYCRWIITSLHKFIAKHGYLCHRPSAAPLLRPVVLWPPPFGGGCPSLVTDDVFTSRLFFWQCNVIVAIDPGTD